MLQKLFFVKRSNKTQRIKNSTFSPPSKRKQKRLSLAAKAEIINSSISKRSKSTQVRNKKHLNILLKEKTLTNISEHNHTHAHHTNTCKSNDTAEYYPP